MSINPPNSGPPSLFPAMPDFTGIINSINSVEQNVSQLNTQFQQVGNTFQGINQWFANFNKQDFSNWGVRIILIVIGLVFVVFGVYKLL